MGKCANAGELDDGDGDGDGDDDDDDDDDDEGEVCQSVVPKRWKIKFAI